MTDQKKLFLFKKTQSIEYYLDRWILHSTARKKVNRN